MKRNFKEIVTEGLRMFYNDIIAAKWAIILIVAYFVFLKKFLYSLCPLVIMTGYPCPTCGMTRAAFRVLRLDFVGAWEVHPFIYPIILLVIFFMIWRYVLQKKQMEWLKWAAVVLILAMIAFYIWRMYRFFPDTPPMTYYYNNYLHRILQRF